MGKTKKRYKSETLVRAIGDGFLAPPSRNDDIENFDYRYVQHTSYEITTLQLNYMNCQGGLKWPPLI